jgi:phenylalanyl-tRNA synthetase beta chain
MRTSLRASLLQAVAANLRLERGTVALFECAHVFLTAPDGLPEEREMLVGAVAGGRMGRWGEPLGEALDFYDAKGLLEETFERVGAAVEFRAEDEYALLRGRTAALYAGDQRIGVCGQVHPQVASKFDIAAPAFLFEVDVAALEPQLRLDLKVKSLSRFPAVSQDIALLVDQAVPAGKVTQLIAGSALVVDVKLFDVYEGAPLPEGKRSLAYTVQFQSLEKTLTDSEVADARRRIVRRLEHEVGAELRGG